MKKLLLSAAAALLLAAAAAPAAQAQSIRFGLKAGGSLSNLSGGLVNQNRYNNRFGFHGGMMLNFGLANDLVLIQPEVLYSQKGFDTLTSHLPSSVTPTALPVACATTTSTCRCCCT